MNSNTESARLFAGDVRKWIRKRLDASRQGPTRENFRVSPYEK